MYMFMILSLVFSTGTCSYMYMPFCFRFTRPENLGSESKIKCNKCRSYQVSLYVSATSTLDTVIAGALISHDYLASMPEGTELGI